MLTFLLTQCPELLFGGYSEPPDISSLLKGFWATYKAKHGTHEVFRHYADSLEYCLPVLLYGDEGRGRRRGQTAVFTLETPIGLDTVGTSRTGKRKASCDCCPRESTKKRSGCQDDFPVAADNSAFAVHNYKRHPFLTKWLLWVLPCATYKAFPALIPALLDRIAQDLRCLFYDGIECGSRLYTVVCIGMKGDIKWHAAVGQFNRYYSNMGRVRDLACCHECMAGLRLLPFEDVKEEPSWAATMYAERPWCEDAHPPLMAIPFDRSSPESFYRRDAFHVCKMGIYRHLAASVLATLILWEYFHEVGAPKGNGIPILLVRATGHFRLWCQTVKKTAALRTITKFLMMWPNLRTSPWFNTKGSDCMLLISWLQVLLTQCMLSPKKPEHSPVMEAMRTVLKAAKDSFELMYSHRLLLDRDCALQLYEMQTTVLTGYCWLAQQAMRFGIVAFAMVPKIHSWKHEAFEIWHSLKRSQVPRIINPITHACEQNEEF